MYFSYDYQYRETRVRILEQNVKSRDSVFPDLGRVGSNTGSTLGNSGILNDEIFNLVDNKPREFSFCEK
jgi:hypothetical protein